MRKVQIGTTDLLIAPINLGGNVFGWTLDEKASFEILDAFYEAGFNFLDTADTYPWWVNGVGGSSEMIIGKWLKERNIRTNIILATKVGSENKEHGPDISRAHIIKSVEESLKRLQTDYIDLYYAHFDDQHTPVEEIMAAYDELAQSGKIRYTGVSNFSPERIESSFKVAEDKNSIKYSALQPHYNLLERTTYETQYLPLAKEYQLAVFPYWALASGFLSGKYRTKEDLNKSQRGGAAEQYLNEKGMKVLAVLDQIGAKYSAVPTTIALAWLLAQPTITAPIVSATSIAQLHTILAATDVILDTEDLRLLEEASL